MTEPRTYADLLATKRAWETVYSVVSDHPRSMSAKIIESRLRAATNAVLAHEVGK